MIAGLQANNPSFLANLSDLENRISRVTQQMTSGIRVSQASDDPSAIAPILAYQGQITYINELQTNLNLAQTDAQTGDSALQTASSLLNQLATLGAQGASSTSNAFARTAIGKQVQQIEQQLVSIANTAVAGRYIFGGDDTSTAPYTFDWSSSGGVIRNTSQNNTVTISDSDGNSIIPRLTAQQIFDVRDSSGTAASGNIFEAVHSLGAALLANDQSGIQNAIDELKAGSTQLGQSTATYGNFESWINQGLATATSHVSNLTQALASIRDADIPTDATELTLDQTALQAAIAAEGSLNTKSLFSYLG
jgi:flagellar hook-associated protein 3 FlgL